MKFSNFILVITLSWPSLKGCKISMRQVMISRIVTKFFDDSSPSCHKNNVKILIIWQGWINQDMSKLFQILPINWIFQSRGNTFIHKLIFSWGWNTEIIISRIFTLKMAMVYILNNFPNWICLLKGPWKISSISAMLNEQIADPKMLFSGVEKVA